MKKVLIILLFLPLLAGCYARHGGIPWFNSNGYVHNPDRIEVQRGDTLYSLSKRYDVSMLDLIEENNLSEPYSLNVGQILRLPQNDAYYTVAKGDTLYSIARKNNISVSSLSKINGLKAPYTLKVGQTLALSNSAFNTSSFADNNISANNTYPLKNDTNKKIPTVTNKQIVKFSSQNTVSTYRKSKFIWPVNGSVVSNFGVVGKGRRNDGINIKAALGTNVKAADKGVVAYAGNELKGFGNLVLIKHADGFITAYAHNAKLYVKKGQKVIKGEKIATVGNTGSVNTPQLHFEVRAGKKALNPRAYLP